MKELITEIKLLCYANVSKFLIIFTPIPLEGTGGKDEEGSESEGVAEENGGTEEGNGEKETETTTEEWETLDLGTTCSCWSLQKSEKAAKEDLARFSTYSNSISQASAKHGIPAEVIKGVISRESRAGALLGK